MMVPFTVTIPDEKKTELPARSQPSRRSAWATDGARIW
jgi:hypothetical protein